MRVLVLDNYDSFTYNLVQYLGELGAQVEAVRNDRATVDELLAGGYERCVVSPGPCTPNEGGPLPLAGSRSRASRLPGSLRARRWCADGRAPPRAARGGRAVSSRV